MYLLFCFFAVFDWVSPPLYFSALHMWQSRVEIEGYSVTYFDRIPVFEAPYR